MACYSIAPCGTCEGCLRIKAMPPWEPNLHTCDLGEGHPILASNRGTCPACA